MKIERVFKTELFIEMMNRTRKSVDDIAETARKHNTMKSCCEPETYRRIAIGKMIPTVYDIVYICETLNCSADYLLGLSKEVN